MRYSRVLCGFILLAFFSSCTTEVKQVEYFNMEAYFQEQVKILDSLNMRVIKIISEDGKDESLNDDSLNWAVEMKLFLDAGLNKPANQGKFIVDTIYSEEDDKKYSIVYSATDPKIKLRYVMIDFDAERVKQVGIKTYTRNNLYTISTTLNYKAMDSYTVQIEEDELPETQKKYVVYTRFLPN